MPEFIHECVSKTLTDDDGEYIVFICAAGCGVVGDLPDAVKHAVAHQFEVR